MQHTEILHPIRKLTAVIVGTLLLVAMAAVPALAQYPPAADLQVACAPESPSPGATVDCTITGAPANVDLDVVVQVDATTVLDTTVTTNADGEAAFSFDVPADAEPGATITISVLGEMIEGTLEVTLMVAEDGVADDDEAIAVDEDLPRTGAETSTLLLAGLIVAIVGVGLVFASRRKQRTTTKV